MKKVISMLAGAAMVFSLVGCGDSGKTEAKVCEATAKGNNGDVAVEVTVEGDKITKVVVKDHAETPGISDKAIEEIPAEIVKKNSVNVDTVSGATFTSQAIIDATKAALQEGGFDVANFEK